MNLTQLVISDEQFASHMEEACGKLVVVYYFLKQSSSCSKMDPVFRDMSFKFQDRIDFLKVDADLCRDTVQRHGIECMPTFVVYRDLKPLALIEGAKPFELETAIRLNLEGPIGYFFIIAPSPITPTTNPLEADTKDKDDTSQGSLRDEVGFSMGPGGIGDLFHFLDPKCCECLNVSDLTPFSQFIEQKSKLQSDCDGQLILVYGFNQLVKIKSLKIKAAPDNGPAMLRLFVNQISTLDFDDVNKFTPTQEIILKSEDLNGEFAIELNQARFHDVKNVHIFIPSNMSGSEVTELDTFILYGNPVNASKGIAGKTDRVVFLD